jgi:chitodextrinase
MSTGKISTRLADIERRLRAVDSNSTPGMLTSRGPNGVGRKPAWRPSRITAGGTVTRYKIVSVQTNYLTCNPYDASGTVDTWETVYVAKPPALRDADGERNRTVGSSTVVEEIRTNYAANDDIYAIESSVPTGVVDGSSESVTWLDMNVDARNWQPKFVEIEGCVESVDKRRMAVVGTVYDPPA